MRISDWSSDVCSSDLDDLLRIVTPADERTGHDRPPAAASGGVQDTSAEPDPGDDPIPHLPGPERSERLHGDVDADGRQIDRDARRDRLAVERPDWTSVVEGKSVSGRVDPRGRPKH